MTLTHLNSEKNMHTQIVFRKLNAYRYLSVFCTNVFVSMLKAFNIFFFDWTKTWIVLFSNNYRIHSFLFCRAMYQSFKIERFITIISYTFCRYFLINLISGCKTDQATKMTEGIKVLCITYTDSSFLCSRLYRSICTRINQYSCMSLHIYMGLVNMGLLK